MVLGRFKKKTPRNLVTKSCLLTFKKKIKTKTKYWWCLYSMQDKVCKPPFENTKYFEYIQCTSGPYDGYWKHLKEMAL